MMIHRLLYTNLFNLLLALFVFVADGYSQTHQVSFEDPAWDFSQAGESQIVNHKGRTSLYLEGKAFLSTANFSDGIIEVDVTTPAPRAFAGILFRTQSPTEYEEMYIRLHKSGSPDAIQYTPVFNDVAGWQLYGPGDGWGMAAFDRNEWIPLRIEVSGDQIRIFAGQSSDAVLVTRLRRNDQSGGVGLWALFGAYFSNFRYTSKEMPTNNLITPESDNNVITHWELSEAFRASEINVTDLSLAEQRNWQAVTSEPNGLVNLSRYLPGDDFQNLPAEGQVDGQPPIRAFAKATIISDSDQIKKLHFGYSDDAVILLNGNPIFTGKSGFRARDPLFQGMIGYHDALFLDLKKGENELVFIVTERFGGWGLMAKFEDSGGVTF
jgi:hypothetical protein